MTSEPEPIDVTQRENLYRCRACERWLPATEFVLPVVPECRLICVACEGKDWWTMTTLIEREPIGLNDRDGTPIRCGDLVEFWFDADEGILEPEDGSESTHMIDEVCKVNGHWAFLCREVGAAAYASRYAAHCRVIGQVEPRVIDGWDVHCGPDD